VSSSARKRILELYPGGIYSKHTLSSLFVVLRTLRKSAESIPFACYKAVYILTILPYNGNCKQNYSQNKYNDGYPKQWIYAVEYFDGIPEHIGVCHSDTGIKE